MRQEETDLHGCRHGSVMSVCGAAVAPFWVTVRQRCSRDEQGGMK